MLTGKLAFFWRIKFFFFREQLKVICSFYSNLRYAIYDLGIHIFAFFMNPYRICRHFWEREGKLEIAYGETPLTTFSQMVQWAGLTQKDTFLELGCGRGKLVFWTASFYGCSCTGVERVTPFFKVAKSLQFFFPSSNLHFLCTDLFKIEVRPFSFIYFYGTTFQEKDLTFLFKRLSSCKPGTKIVTVSFAASHFSPSDFSLEKKRAFSFPWGEAEVFLCQKKTS